VETVAELRRRRIRTQRVPGEILTEFQKFGDSSEIGVHEIAPARQSSLFLGARGRTLNPSENSGLIHIVNDLSLGLWPGAGTLI
jgi:hypothetical protein